MPEIMRTLHRFSRLPRPTLIVVAIVAAVFFASGCFTNTMLNEGRIREQSEERFREFLSIGIDLGFINVDRQKLDELVCITAEAESEDKESAERQEGVRGRTVYVGTFARLLHRSD